MKNLIASSALSLVIFVLSGCTTLVVSEKKSPSYNTWELCTLLYRPYQIYPNWTVDKEENKIIETELKKRGIYDKKSCNVVELAKRQCLEFGYKKDTKDFVGCTDTSYRDINDKVMTAKQNREKEKARISRAISDAFNTQQQVPASTFLFKTCTTSGRTGQVTCY